MLLILNTCPRSSSSCCCCCSCVLLHWLWYSSTAASNQNRNRVGSEQAVQCYHSAMIASESRLLCSSQPACERAISDQPARSAIAHQPATSIGSVLSTGQCQFATVPCSSQQANQTAHQQCYLNAHSTRYAETIMHISITPTILPDQNTTIYCSNTIKQI